MVTFIVNMVEQIVKMFFHVYKAKKGGLKPSAPVSMPA